MAPRAVSNDLDVLAIGAFVLAAIAFAFEGTGIRFRRQRFTWLGVAVIGIVIISNLALFSLAD
tara:strand:- start:764 stop:952 length:189 start_codon:yes stop_codon:yes gene_type:complete